MEITIVDAQRVRLSNTDYMMLVDRDEVNYLVPTSSFEEFMLLDPEQIVGRTGVVNDDSSFTFTDEDEHGVFHRIEAPSVNHVKDQWFYDIKRGKLVHHQNLLTFNMTEEAKKAGVSRREFYEQVREGRVIIVTPTGEDVLPYMVG